MGEKRERERMWVVGGFGGLDKAGRGSDRLPQPASVSAMTRPALVIHRVFHWLALASLGTEHELLISGTVGQVGDRIAAARAEARQRHGWIMDIYLLRPGSSL